MATQLTAVILPVAIWVAAFMVSVSYGSDNAKDSMIDGIEMNHETLSSNLPSAKQVYEILRKRHHHVRPSPPMPPLIAPSPVAGSPVLGTPTSSFIPPTLSPQPSTSSGAPVVPLPPSVPPIPPQSPVIVPPPLAVPPVLATPPTSYIPPIAPSISPPGLTTPIWCIANPQVTESVLQEALDYACSQGADCSAIQPGASCFLPNNLAAHASYAFNSYYQNSGRHYWNCVFKNTGLITPSDPSYGSCVYPSQ